VQLVIRSASFQRLCLVLICPLALGACTSASGPSLGPSSRAPTDSRSSFTAGPASPSRAPRSAVALVTLRVRTLPWRLPVPLSREVALSAGGALELAGGLTAGGVSTDAVLLLNPRTGASRAWGRLATAVHDAAGAVVGGQGFVFGGGSTNSIATIQRLRSVGGSVASGVLPRPRSDLVVAGVNGGVYVLGGYDGSSLDSSVLKTTDGTSFVAIGALPVPVRYPAIAVLGDVIWVFGGQAATGGSDVIQRIDVSTGRSRVAGRLPSALTGAAALVLRGQVYLCGGLTPAGGTAVIRRFDPVGIRTAIVGHLPTALANAASAVIADTGYLLGGEDPHTTSLVVQLQLTAPDPAPSQVTQ
jgi:hypothetical protein